MAAAPRGRGRGVHYVVLNLTGSALFLIALGLLYGTLGTLNLADIALRLPVVPPADAPLVRAALALMRRGLRAARRRCCRSASGCRTPIRRQARRSPRCSR